MGKDLRSQKSSAARSPRVHEAASRKQQAGPPQTPARTIEILVREQRLRLWQDDTLLLCCAISTSKSGVGSEPGSQRTPVGRFRIAEKHGHGAPPGTIFVSRQPVGRWRPSHRVIPDDLITSRILWLDGIEPHNANTYDRYIYLHGTNQEHLLGTPHSHGCVRMSNDAVIALFELAPVDTKVVIR